ncbi:unnamed protein product [Macrosiphum euphorbiae]|uniref:Uncharacterized protein n=1 Tax=Macrosiphum euphorbiae TaxID=13131 RepID=A0AAV0XWA7_9HEMI|nr:unnamed protein product [Macrosiphum euphorbiae]
MIPDSYRQTCNLQTIRINCKGTMDGEKLDQADGTYLSVYVGNLCSIQLLRGEDDEEATIMQFWLSGDRIIIKQFLIEPITNQNYQSNNQSMEPLEKETRKRSLSDKLETTTPSNNTERTVTTSPEQIKSDAIISTPTTTTQVQNEENITKQLGTTTTQSNVVTTVKESHVNVTIVEENTEINKLRDVTESKESIGSTTMCDEPTNRNGSESKYIYIISVTMGIVILVMIISAINIARYYKLVERNRFNYLTTINLTSYKSYDDIDLTETQV